MKRQAEEFKINQVRQLRTSTLAFLEICNQVPYSIFTYLKNVFQARIEQLILQTETKYNSYKIADDEQKKLHLKMFRPNLENPANKDATTELNKREIKRSDDIKDVSFKRFLVTICSKSMILNWTS